jgi:hypothetical protein
MGKSIARPGTSWIAEIPYGASYVASFYKGEPAWIIAPVNEPPYWLFRDGTKKPIEPTWEDNNA